jgi:hypothetical protein
MQKKKEYLNSYLNQETLIERYYQMLLKNPENKDYYNQKILEAKALRKNIELKISEVGDETLCELLFQKYVFGKTLEEISYIINYSKRHTERLHIKALEKFNM